MDKPQTLSASQFSHLSKSSNSPNLVYFMELVALDEKVDVKGVRGLEVHAEGRRYWVCAKNDELLVKYFGLSRSE